MFFNTLGMMPSKERRLAELKHNFYRLSTISDTAAAKGAQDLYCELEDRSIKIKCRQNSALQKYALGGPRS